MNKAILNWSAGKDSALALYHTLAKGELKVQTLVSSISAEHQRITMHGVRRELLLQQTQAIGLALEILELASDESMESYNLMMQNMYSRAKSSGISHSIFGDIFLEDLKAYRDTQLEKVQITGSYPLWKKDTKENVLEFIELGFRAIVVCVEENKLSKDFLGKEITKNFIDSLPSNVDPSGENGEFHSFVFDGPLFNKKVEFELDEISYQNYTPKTSSEIINGFYFCDLIPKT